MKNIPDIHDVRHILICRPEGCLGREIASSCCYREIKKASPQTKITVACYAAAYDFCQHNPYVDEVFKLPLGAGLRPNRRWGALLWAALKLRRKNFDLLLDTSGNDFLNWRLFKRMAAGDRVLDSRSSPVQPFGSPQASAAEHEAAVLRLLGVAEPDKSYDLPVLPTARAAVAQILEREQIQKYILLYPGNSLPKNAFRPDVLKELCAALRSLKVSFVLPLAPSCTEKYHDIFKDSKDVFVVKPADIFELFEWVRRAALVVAPDTPVVHIAAGFEKPSLVFYAVSPAHMPDNPKAQALETDKTDVNVFDWWKLESIVAGFKKTL